MALSSKGLVGNHLLHLDPAGGGDDGLGAGVVDPNGKLLGSEAAKDHRVHHADAGAGQHGHHRLGDHGHVDDQTVPLFQAGGPQRSGETGDFLLQFPVGDPPDDAGDRAVVNQGGLLRPPVLHLPVHGVVAGVEPAALEPADELPPGDIEDTVPLAVPMHDLGCLGPEGLRLLQGTAIDGFVGWFHGLVSCLRNRITISDGGSTGKRLVREALCVSANRHRCAPPPRNLHRPKGFGRNGAVFGVAPPHNE